MTQPGDVRTPALYPAIVAVFVTCLVTANIVAVKLVSIRGLVLPAGVFVFPLSYLFGDVLTEVYGYAHARRAIWLGFGCNLLAVAAILLGQALPPAGIWDGQAAYERILGYSPRLLAASFAAYLLGEFVNSFVLARLKIATGGRWLWLRCWSSTLLGQLLDSAVFISLAFAGTVPAALLPGLVGTQWAVKAVYEVAATPLTYAVVGFLKRREGIDVYDRGTNFNPLALAAE
jgi:queuosine precursor transporter